MNLVVKGMAGMGMAIVFFGSSVYNKSDVWAAFLGLSGNGKN